MTLEELQIKFTADVAGLKTELNDVKKSVGGLEAPTGKATGALGGLAKMGGMIAAAGIGVKLVGIGKEALAMANEVTESESLFEVSMGNMADDARAWSDELSKSLGVNAYEARRNVGVLNTMFKSMGLGTVEASDMAKSLTMLSQDMASFYNLDPTEAFTKLQAGITGEAEGLKRLGIMIDENTVQQYALRKGIIKEGQAMTAQQKVMARYGAIVEQTGDAQGDLARTMESPSNQLRKLNNEFDQAKIALGQALQPALIAVLPVITGLATGIKDVIESFQGEDGATDALEGAALSLDDARKYVKSVVDTSSVDVMEKIEQLNLDVEAAIKEFETTETALKTVILEIEASEPTKTGYERITAAVDELKALVPPTVNTQPVTAKVNAILKDGKVTEKEKDGLSKWLNKWAENAINAIYIDRDKRIKKIDAFIAAGKIDEEYAGELKAAIETETEKLIEAVEIDAEKRTKEVDAQLAAGQINEGTAGALKAAIEADTETRIKAIEIDADKRTKAVDAMLVPGGVTEKVGGELKAAVETKAEEQIGVVTATVSTVNVEIGAGVESLTNVSYAPGQAAKMGKALSDYVNAQDNAVNIEVKRVEATWAGDGEVGDAVTGIFTDAQTAFNTKKAELQAIAEKMLSGVSTEQMWEDAIRIKEEMNAITAFMFEDNTGKGKIVTAAFDGSGKLSDSGIKNMMAAFNEQVVANTEASKKLLNQKIGDLMSIPPDVFAKAFPGETLAGKIAEETEKAAAALSLDNNTLLAQAASSLAPSIGEAIASGELPLDKLLAMIADVNTMFEGVDYTALTEDSKAAFGELIKAFNVSELSMLFDEGGTFANVLDKLGVTLGTGGEEAGGAGGQAVAQGILRAEGAVTIASNALTNATNNTLNRGRGGSFSSGENLGQGLADGIRSKEDEVVAAAKTLAAKARDAMKNVLAEESPSKVTREIGEYFGEGFVIGMQDMAGAIYRTSAGLASDAVAGIQGVNGTIGVGVNGSLGDTGVSGAIAQGVAMGVQDMMNRLQIDMNLDGERLGRASIKAINGVLSRSGRTILNVGNT